MNGCRLDLRRVLEQSFEDVHGFPDAARDEVAEQGDVQVGDMVVGDSAKTSVIAFSTASAASEAPR